MHKTKIRLIEMQIRWREILEMMGKDVGATRSDNSAITDDKPLPAAGTSVQARERWERITLVAVLDEMVDWK